MTFHRRLTVLALASIPLGCPSDSTPSTDDTSGTTENDDDDETTDDPSSVTLTTDDPSTSTDPSTTVDPDSSTDPTEDPTTETTDEPTETTDDPTTESSSTDGESSSSSSSTTDTAGDDCAQFEVTGDLIAAANGRVFFFRAADISGASDDQIDDSLQFQFYAPETGTFDLAAAPNDNFETCEQCILVIEDPAKDGPARLFYQSQGTLEVDADSDVDGGFLFYGSITGVRLIEVTIDPDSNVSTPVDNGLCIDLVDGDVGTIPVPDEWTCDPLYYGTGLLDDCDCGCGAVDLDCADMTAGSCDFCDDFGSCGDGGDCPANIDPVNNAICVESMDESQELVAGPGLAAAIGDDDYDGTIGTMTCVTLPLAASGPDTVTGVQLELGMVHSWIGDLTIKVFSPEGTAVTVLSRPGAVEASDDGVPLLGDSSNLAISSPLSYLNGGATDAEVMGSTIGDGQVVCADDTLCAYAPNPGAAVAGDFSAFVGESAVGNWQVCVGDGGPGDLGSIDAVTLTVDQGA